MKNMISVAFILVVAIPGATGAGVAEAGRRRASLATASVPTLPEEVVREVVERNQGIEALEARATAAAEVPSQLGSLPDPLFMVGLSNLPLSTSSTPLTGVQFELRQTFPWPGKLALRESAAEHGARAQKHLVEDRRNLLRARAWSLLWELAFLEQHRELAREMATALEQFTEVAEASYVAGSGRQQDIIKPRVERHRIDDLIESIDRAADTVRSRINALRHRPPGTPIQAPKLPDYKKETPGQSPSGAGGQTPDAGGQSRYNGLPSQGKLLEYAESHNPLFRAARARTASARHLLALAGKDYFPDITVGLQYRLRWVETGDAVAGADFIGVTLGVNLPVWFATKQRPAEAERASRLSAALAEEQRLRDEISDGIERILQAIRRDTAQAAIYRDRIIPETRQALDSSLADYRAGRLEFISVLDNLLKLFGARVELSRRATRVLASLAELEHLLGGLPEPLQGAYLPDTGDKEQEDDK